MWASVITQTKEKPLENPVWGQHHKPLAFLRGKFSKAQQISSTFEKEEFVGVQTFKRVSYLLCRAKLKNVYTNHKNLLHVHAPLALQANSAQLVISKIYKWAVQLSEFGSYINYFAGLKDVFADMLPRRSTGYWSNVANTGRVVVLHKNVSSASTKTFSVTIEEVKKKQKKHGPPSMRTKDEEEIWMLNEKIWISKNANYLELGIAAARHCDKREHRACAAELDIICKSYWRRNMKESVRKFTQSGIRCISSRNWESISRLLANALYGEKPNELLHEHYW